MHRRDQADIKSRELGVLFDQLRAVGNSASLSFQPTLGSFLNRMNTMHGVQNSCHPHLRDIINGFRGVVRPGEMLGMFIST